MFDPNSGEVQPVTVVQTGQNVIHQVKTEENDGYRAVQLGFGSIEERKMDKATQGHFKKLNSEPTKVILECELDSASEEVKSGTKVGLEIFEHTRFVDVIGTTKGRGFSGTIKRHHFKRGRMTHGNSNRREAGSIGSNTFPAHVIPGKKMSGHLGNERVTIKNLKVVSINKEAGLIYIKGAIPGRNKGIVFIRKA